MIRGWGLIAVLTVCAWPTSSAWAGTIYRCDSADGARSYVSKRVPGARCSVMSSYTPAKADRPRPTPTAAPAPEPVATGTDTSGPAPADAGAPRLAPERPGATLVSATPGPPPQLPAQPGQGTRRLQTGQVYSYVKDGVRHYTSARPQGADVASLRTIKYTYFETCYACGVLPGVNFGSVRLNTTAYAAEIREAALRFGVEEAVVRAIMHAESAFNPNALSRAGAQGLMQLMPATARRFGVSNSFDPAQNIRGGVEYLAWLLKRFKGDLTLAAAGYNAGEGAVDRYKGVPPYSETQRYVQRVAMLAERYRSHSGVVAAAGGP